MNLGSRLGRPIDADILGVFRIGFGLLMLWEAWRFWHYGWIEAYWLAPAVNFKYYGFSWVQPWPGDGMYVHFLVLGLCSPLRFVARDEEPGRAE